MPHIPVLREPIVQHFVGKSLILDGTFGAGGHSRMLLEADDQRKIIAIDQDPSARQYADTLAKQYPRRITLRCCNFDQMPEVLRKEGLETVDGVLIDAGYSSMQVDQASRGFSFSQEGPLDMRMSASGITAEEVVNDYAFQVLVEILRTYGEENLARPIVRNIIRHREQGRITKTTQLRDIIHEVKQRRGDKIDPATKTFQALRVCVNDELGALERGLVAAEQVLGIGGVLAVISFHSLEDRIVKRFLKGRGELPSPSRHLPPTDQALPCFALLHKGVITAKTEEVAQNPRARSAKLRIAQKINEPDQERISAC